jgi:C-terminal processing protease CtpA/Prc
MLDYGAVEFADICLAERSGAAKTYGKGIMQETKLINILQQDAITLTTAEIRWPISDRSIHGRGVLPEDGALTVEENVDFETETVNAIQKLLEK